jgi:ribosomal protein S18 acetylase RimI-like enzyme
MHDFDVLQDPSAASTGQRSDAMAFTVRPASAAAAAVIHALILELAEYEKLLDEARRGSDPEALARHLAPEARPRVEAFIAQADGGQALGFALCYHHYSTFHTNWGLYLEDLYVRPEYRGKGVGFALLRQVARLAVERGCVRLEWQVLDWNTPAIDFYHRIGATAMDDWITMRLTGPALEGVAAAAPEPARD